MINEVALCAASGLKLGMDKINLVEKFALFADHWNPRVIGQINNTAVKLVKFQGEFVWHSHELEDEMFLVVSGSFSMHLRDKIVPLEVGECIIIPKGVEHKPVAEKEVWVMLIEPSSTVNTGTVLEERTRAALEHI
jgi:mannose-6-phosphate isomerase-like protein (cupin superfamily)